MLLDHQAEIGSSAYQEMHRGTSLVDRMRLRVRRLLLANENPWDLIGSKWWTRQVCDHFSMQ